MSTGRFLFRCSLFFLIAGVGVCLVETGCRKPEAVSEQEKPPAKPVSRTADRGAIKLTVTADKDKISIAENIRLSIVVDAEAGIEVEMPEFGAEPSGFAISDFRDLPVVVNDGRRIYEQTYDLEIFVSGDYTIPAITAYYRDKRVKEDVPTEEVNRAELSTESFTIQVKSLLDGQFDYQEFRDVKDVATPPLDRTWSWLYLAMQVLGGGILAAIVILLIQKYSRKSTPTVAIPPHEWAFMQMQLLAESKLVEEGKVQEFYYRLNEIARTYIELRFALKAPERTTEEFLAEMQENQVLPRVYREPLAKFLQACDMVKYACYNPSVEEIEGVFNAARDFIEQTKYGSTSVAQEVAA